MIRIEFHAMGSRMLAALDNTTHDAESALQQLPTLFEKWEQILSRFRSDSELNQLNRSGGQPVAVSQILGEVFMAAREGERYTGGLVRPTMLDALIHAGYDRPFEQLGAMEVVWSDPAMVVHPPALAVDIFWDEPTHTLFLPEGVHLDFGGVAKGWAAQKSIYWLKQFGPILVDAGGDIAISGPRADGEPWLVGIRDPFHPEGHFDMLCLNNGGVATSGTDYHRWKQGDAVSHHLIDPATNLPVVSDVLTATIIAPDALHAEAAAKAVVIAGSQDGLEWLEAAPDLAGVLVLQSGETIYSQRIHSYLWRSYEHQSKI